MNIKQLEKNIIDMLIEQQIKLGYLKEVVRLYYPKKSVYALLDVAEDREILSEVEDSIFDKSGNIHIKSLKDGRICIEVSKELGEYVHKNKPQNLFIEKLIELIRNHCSIEDVFDLFKSESNQVYIEELKDSDFEYLVYFKDENPDDFYYCFNVEGKHVTYHRFTKIDYMML